MTAVTALESSLELARAVEQGLTKSRKTLSASLLYDALGSALFEAITLLPEYGLTRADAALLQLNSPEIVKSAQFPSLIVELGSGTGTKTRHLLDAASKYGRVQYFPIDISRAALDACEAALCDLSFVRIQAIESDYIEGLGQALENRGTGERALVLFLGSTIGNFDPEPRNTFLHSVRGTLRGGDSMLLGTDLVKPERVLISAYDDSLGVTAAFNLNLLVRINRELGGNFDVRQFSHAAIYDSTNRRIEMHLRSRVEQSVSIPALNLRIDFAAGETIWTESCYKFEADQVRELARRTGWRDSRQWLENTGGFAETLFIA